MNVVIYALLGKLIIYLAQKFPFISIPIVGRLWEEKRFLGKLFGCDLCAGTWVYFFLALILHINLLNEFGYIPVLYEFLTGAIMSFVVHTFSLGWNSKFQLIKLE